MTQPAPDGQGAARAGEAFALARRLAPWPLMLVDGQARVLRATPDATATVAMARGIGLRDGILSIERARAQRQLIEAIAAVASGVGDRIVGVPRDNGRTGLALKVMPAGPLFAADGAAALVALADVFRPLTVPRDAVMSLFLLTEREADLAEHFSTGLRVDEIADRMGVATNTVRVHLRNVFAKTGCSSQVELARLFLLIP